MCWMHMMLHTKKTDVEGERNGIIGVNFSELFSSLDEAIFFPASEAGNEITRLVIWIIRVYNFRHTKSFKCLHHQNTHVSMNA